MFIVDNDSLSIDDVELFIDNQRKPLESIKVHETSTGNEYYVLGTPPMSLQFTVTHTGSNIHKIEWSFTDGNPKTDVIVTVGNDVYNNPSSGLEVLVEDYVTISIEVRNDFGVLTDSIDAAPYVSFEAEIVLSNEITPDAIKNQNRIPAKYVLLEDLGGTSRYNIYWVDETTGIDWSDVDEYYLFEFRIKKVDHIVDFSSFLRNQKNLIEFSCDVPVRPNNLSGMFYDCLGLQSIDVSNFDTSNVTDMSKMFDFCRGLQSIDVSHFDTSNVTDMSKMFHNCINLQSIDLSNFDTSNVTSMNSMFSYCYLQTLDVSHFDTSKVTDMGAMFYGCGNLQSIDVSNFDTSNVTNMSGMFNGCSNLQTLDLSNFDTSNVTRMTLMFYKCGNLQSIDVSRFDISKVTDMAWMFRNTNANIKMFRTIPHANFSYFAQDSNSCFDFIDTSNAISTDSMFIGATGTPSEASDAATCIENRCQWVNPDPC